MKVLRIIARLNVGGPARHVVWLTEALNKDGFISRLVAGSVPDGEEDMGYLATAGGIDTIYIEEMSRELSPKDLVSLAKVYRLMLRERPDIVHTHTAKAGTIGRTAAFFYRWLTPGTLIGRPRKVGIVHTFHGHVFHSYYGRLKTKFFLAVEKLLARFATDRIIAISGRQLDEINGQFGVGRSTQFELIPLGIDLEPFEGVEEGGNSIRETLNAARGDLLVGFVGRLTEIKNVPMLLQAAAICRDRHSQGEPPLKFVVVGDGHCRSLLESLAAEFELGNSVRFLGSRTDTEAVYAAIDIVALTSLNEGTPLSLIEAMASRRPVISTLVGGVPDLLGDEVEDHGSFKVFRRGVGIGSADAAAFADGLRHLADNAELRRELAEAGRSFVKEMYSKDRLVSDIKRLYGDLMAGGHSRK